MSDEKRPSSSAILASELTGAERRVAVRYSCTMTSLCQTKTARTEDFWWWGTICDISTTGVGLLITRRFEPGTELVLEPLTEQKAFEPMVVCVIRTTKQPEGGWLLGCKFARQAAGSTEDTAALPPALEQASEADSFDAT